MNPVPLVVFVAVVIAVVICVIKDVKFVIPKTNLEVTINYAFPPVLGVCILLASQSLTMFEVIQGGLIGDDRIQPFAILIIFNGLAYLCISLDLTGLLAWIALRVAGKAGSSALRLFTYFFLLSSLFTVFTSNDIVILTLTPIIYYCSKATNMNPMPFLFGEFFAANICSLVLLIGNPTNIIVGEANHLTFADYSKWMILPAFLATSTAFIGCWLKFRNELDQSFVPPELDPSAAFKDKRAAVFHSSVLILTLALLTAAPFIGARMWLICAVSTGVILAYNVVFWPWNLPTQDETRKPLSLASGRSYQSLGDSNDKPLASGRSYQSLGDTNDKPSNSIEPLVIGAASDKSDELLLPEKEPMGFIRSEELSLSIEDSNPAESAKVEMKENPLGVQHNPCVKKSLQQLPWKIIPFVFGMFVLVEGLNQGGWVDAIAYSLVDRIPAGAGPDAVLVSSFLMTGVTILLCNLINNQPATILLSRVIISDKFMALSSNVRSVGMFAVILGSNLGANFTLIGALAGIMWAKILAEKNLEMTYLAFAKLGFLIMPFVAALSAGFLFVEHML